MAIKGADRRRAPPFVPPLSACRPLCTSSTVDARESPSHPISVPSVATGAFSSTMPSTRHSGGTPLPSPCPMGAPSPSGASVVDHLPPEPLEHHRCSGTSPPAAASASSSTTGHPSELLHPYGCPAGSPSPGRAHPSDLIIQKPPVSPPRPHHMAPPTWASLAETVDGPS
jgi:hypothetical protein